MYKNDLRDLLLPYKCQNWIVSSENGLIRLGSNLMCIFFPILFLNIKKELCRLIRNIFRLLNVCVVRFYILLGRISNGKQVKLHLQRFISIGIYSWNKRKYSLT